MAVSIRLIRRRIRSVQNTAKVTRAMEMISAVKMRKAQQRALAGRPYAEKLNFVLSDLAAAQVGLENEQRHPLLQRREVKKIEVIHFTPDRGLCGGLVSNINRVTASFQLSQTVPVALVTVGKKGRDFMVRYGRDVRASFVRLGDNPTIADILPIAHIVMEDYTNKEVDAVYLAYTDFVSTLVQKAVLHQLLPVEPPKAEGGVGTFEYIYEPNQLEIFNALLPRFVEMQLYHAVLEALASEHSARMVAMRNATENAKEMTESLTLMLNKARQEMITTELLDITGGVTAMEQV
jgi:F-type H+-transporting ATPase subunit gamma